jgi:hypothetical protein
MRSLSWQRADRIAEVRERIWLYLSPSAGLEQQTALEAAALLQLTEQDVLTLARLHFLLTSEVRALLDGLPRLLRQLATTTAYQEEHSAERVRGAILWGSTIAARAAGGLPHLYVTAPAQRAFQTPENELLVFVLDAIAQIGQQTGWHDSDGQGIRQLIGDRTAAAQRWRQARMLLEVERRPPTPRAVSRVRTGRHHRRYRHAISTWERYRSLIAQLNRAELRNLIESTAIVTRDNPTLFELLCTFAVIDALEACGWQTRPLRLFHGHLRLTAQRDDERLELWYQTTPRVLAAASRYTEVLRQHRFANPSGLRPDMVLRQTSGGQERWLLVEAKLYEHVQDGARAALQNLLAYRRAFDTGLATNSGVYGLGIAWGTDLHPAPTEVMLCTPDTIPTAILQFVG